MTVDTDQSGAPQLDIVLGIAASPTFATDGVCFAARRSGLYRSDDGGASWLPAYEWAGTEEDRTTTEVSVSPSFATDRTVFSGGRAAVLRSSDGGRTWLAAELPPPPPVVSALAVSPDYSRDGTVLAATIEDGVLRSADRGVSWAAWNFGLLDLGVLSLALSPAFGEDETAFAGVQTGLFRSTNGGRAWRETGFPGDCAPVLSLAISPNFTTDGVVLAGTEEHGLYRSLNGGDSWTQVGGGVVEGAVNAILLAPPLALVLLDDAVFVSNDDGDTWVERETGGALSVGATCFAAPSGLADDAPLIVGLVEGGVARV